MTHPDRTTIPIGKQPLADILLAVSEALSTTYDIRQFLHTVHATLKRFMGADNFFVALLDETGERLSYPYYHDEMPLPRENGSIQGPDNDLLFLEVLRNGRPVVATETEIRKQNVMEPFPMAWIGIPLWIKGSVVGVMAVQHYSDPHHYGADAVEALVAVSKQVALALERKMNEDALVENETKYRTILDNIVEGYYEVDIQGNFTFFNNSMSAMLGYSPQEMMGMNNRQFMDAETARKVFHTFHDVYTSGKIFQGFDWVLVRKDGTKCYIETSVSLIRNKKNDAIGFRGLARDITARKLAETERKQMEKQLQHAQRMESIGTLAGGIAHNFNNLLMAIQGYTTIMLLETDPSDKRYRMIQCIEKQVSAGSSLTAQLLGYAREGKYEIRSINLNQVVKESAETFAVTRREIRVHQILEPDLDGIIADRGQLEQVLMNLLVNAADAMPEGGDLYLQTENRSHRDIHADNFVPKEGSYVCLTVRDTGIGMDSDTMEHIFEPFFTTKDISKGSGLGLASAYGIIKAHGGYLQASSQINEGATFSIYLPASRKAVEIGTKKKEVLIRGEGTVLFVDDDETVRSLGSELLKVLGYETILASGGREAIDIYRTREKGIDLVILDMIMPDMSGGAVYDQLKSINSDIKVLLSSGYSVDGQATDILNRGCNGFIQKPFSLTDISVKMQQILRGE